MRFELQPDRGLELLAVHHEAAVAADRHHPAVRIEHRGHHRRRQARAHRRQRVVEQQRVGDARAVVAREPDLVHAVVERDDAVLGHHLAHVAHDALRGRREALLGRAGRRCARGSPARSGSSAPAFGGSRPSSRSASSARSGRCRRSPRPAGNRPARPWPACSRRGSPSGRPAPMKNGGFSIMSWPMVTIRSARSIASCT